MKKLLLFLKYLVISCLIGILGFGAILYLIFHDTPNFMRNHTVDNIKLEAFVTNDERLPIIRTFRKEAYETLSEEKKIAIRQKAFGHIEGDIPCIKDTDTPSLTIQITKKNVPIKLNNEAHLLIQPTNHYLDKAPKDRAIILPFEKIEGTSYPFKLKRYTPLFEKYQLESYLIKVDYEVEGIAYVSIFALHYSNAPEGTDFFNNETLKTPLPPEVE